MNVRWVAGLSILLLAAATNGVPASLRDAIARTEAKPTYAHSVVGIFVADRTTGDTLIDQLGEKMYVPGSIMKTYSTAAALKAYGPRYRFRTPVYRTGNVAGGVLHGNLVLVASGDFSFGLREQSNGTLAFNSLPDIDHNYADTGFAGPTVLRNSHPLAALDELARNVRARGITHVQGNVVIDDRLFREYTNWPDGLLSPMWINENLIDVLVTPTKAGQRARIDWRPKVGVISVVSTVTTVANATDAKPLAIAQRDGVVEISGQIAADAKPMLRNVPIVHPSALARVAFIEALRRVGIGVSAPASGPNPENLLPRSRSYPAGMLVAQHVSPPLSEFVKVILKVSYNRGADLMVCLVAVKAGSRDCGDGLATEVKTITALGVSPESTIVYDGAGSDDDGRTSPVDQVRFLRTIVSQPWGRFVEDGMAILGVDGTQATNQVGTPAAGKVRVKDGSRVDGSPSGQVYLAAKTQVGYMTTQSGRQLVYAVFLNNVPTTPSTVLETFTMADHDVGSIVAAIQAAY